MRSRTLLTPGTSAHLKTEASQASPRTPCTPLPLHRDIQQHVVHHGRSCIPTPRWAAHLTPYCSSSPYTASRWTGPRSPPQAYAQQVFVPPGGQPCGSTPGVIYHPLPSQAVEKTLGTPAKVRPQVLKHTCMPLMVGPALSSISTTTPPPIYHTEELEPPKPPQHHLSLSTLRPCPHCH